MVLRLPGKWGQLVALLAGAIAPLALAPYGFWPIGIASLLLLIICLQDIEPRQGFWRGWLFGLGLFGVGSSWVYVSIHLYGQASVILAAFLTLVFVAVLAFFFCALLGYCYVRWTRHSRIGVLAGFPALWVLFEWSRSWLFTGFPWLMGGYAHTDTVLASWAPVVGIYGLGFIVALSAALLYQILQHAQQKDYRGAGWHAGGLLLPWLVALLLGSFSWTRDVGEPISVALSQPNIPQDIKWLPVQRNKTLQLLRQSVGENHRADLLIWPENAIPAFYHQAGPFINAIAAQARDNNLGIISGIPYQRTDETTGQRMIHNSIAGFGMASGEYHKQKLVPFGEYVPLQSVLRGVISFFDLPMSDFRPGPRHQAPLELRKGDRTLSIAPYICYEIVYPDFVRQLGRDSSLLLTISDDSWFGKSIGPDQHLQMVRMRALENGRYIMRGTNTGLTALVDPAGAIISQAPQFEQATLRGEVRQVEGTTPFGIWGSWPVLVLCAGCLVISLRRKRSVNQS